MIIAVIINVVLDLIFIIYFGMGVEGAAIATVIAQVSSSVLCLVYIYARRNLCDYGSNSCTFHTHTKIDNKNQIKYDIDDNRNDQKE